MNSIQKINDMENLTNLLTQQKTLIEAELKQVGSAMFDLKIQEIKLKKMLKAVNAQIDTATEETKKP
jgi:hypothetical protein